MKYLMFFLTLITIKSYAQTDEEKVKAPIIAMFDGMRTSDTTLMRTAFAPGAILQTIAKNKEGQLSVRSENINDFVAFIGKPHTEIYDERITFDVVKIDADLAIAWTPYQFYVSDKFSHCGVNSFQLVRLNGAWKIQYIIDTRRKEGCK